MVENLVILAKTDASLHLKMNLLIAGVVMARFLVQTSARLVRKSLVRFAAPVIARGRGVHVGVVKRNIVHSMLDIEGPSSDVWDGPIFIHIPKAAGSSILETGVKWTRGHKSLSFYLRHCPSGTPMPLTFTVVRHPVDRFMSAFYYLSKGGINPHDDDWADRHLMGMSDHNIFAEHLAQRPELLKQMHLQPQLPMITNESGEVAVDTVLRFETLAQDWPGFAKANALIADLPHTNALSKGDKTRPASSARCISILRELYAGDFNVLGYT